MTVAMRQDAEEETMLRKQEEELQMKKISKNRRIPTFTSMLTENEMQIHNSTSQSRPSSPGTHLPLFPDVKGSKQLKGEKAKQMSTKKLKKLIKVE